MISKVFNALKFSLALSLVGCASMPEEGRATLEGVGVFVVVAGSAALIEHRHRREGNPMSHAGIDPPNCAATPSLCQ